MMCRTRKYYEIMANRKSLWLVSVVVIAVGLIFNIILGTHTDISFTGGAMLRYSYPESGLASGSDVEIVPAATELSGTDVQNTEPTPAETPVIISGGDAPAQQSSGSDLPSEEDAPQNEETVSDSQPGAGVVSDGDQASGTDVPEIAVQPDYSTDVQPDEAVRVISAALGEEVSVTVSTDAQSPTGGENKRLTVILESGSLGQDADELIRGAMKEKYPNVMLTLRESNQVNPSAGKEFKARCALAVTLSALFIMVYMGLRYRGIGGWTAGISALIAILHDCLVAYFTFVVFGFAVDNSFIAVVLALIGLSINSTIVVFDRIRENRGRFSGSLAVAHIANKSINETMGRTISTDLCVFIAMAVLAAVSAVYGIGTLLSFALPMMTGIAAGCYSSLCLSGTIWVTLQEQQNKLKEAAGRRRQN